MTDPNKQQQPYFSLTDYVSKQYQGLTQGVKDLIQTASDAWHRKLPNLEGKFPCSTHPSHFIKTFTTHPADKKPFILCEECIAESSPEKPVSLDISRVNSSKATKGIGELYDHFTESYEQIRHTFELKNINKIMLENFLDKIPDMQTQMTLNIDEEKQKFAGQAEKAIELFTAQINSIKERYYQLLNTELETFSGNLNHTRTHINSFLSTLTTFENLPKNEDLTQKIGKLKLSEDLVGFIKENTANVEVLSLKLDSFNHQSSEHYRYALYLMRKTYQHLQKPPKNPISPIFKYVPEQQTPTKYLKQLQDSVIDLDLPKNLKLDSPIPDFSISYPLEGWTEHPRKVENFQIDALDFFYPNTPQGLQCLHYYDYDKKFLVMVNLEELSHSITGTTTGSGSGIKNIVYKIPIPKEIKIPRYTKTISLPEGSVYFIGGDTSDTIAFEFKETELARKASSASLRKTSTEDPKDIRGSGLLMSFARRKDTLKSEDGQHITSHGSFTVKGKMNKPKYGHGLVYIGNGSIYSIAGYDTSSPFGYTTKCERYIIKEDKWLEVKDCLYAVNHPGVCTFDNRYIYKFGGFVNDEGRTLNKIERYHIERDFWTEIQIAAFSGPVQLYPKSLPIQINDQEIMILGGHGGHSKEFLFTDDCAFLKVNKKEEGRVSTKKFLDEGMDYVKQNTFIEEEIEMPKELMLPIDNRLVFQSIIFDGKLYCLTLKPGIDEIVKNVMTFDGKNWSIVL